MSSFQVINPFTQKVDRQYPLHNLDQARQRIQQALQTQANWAKLDVTQRIRIIQDALGYFETERATIARDISLQMGRPIRHAHNELNGFFERAYSLCDAAPSALSPVLLPPKPGFERRIEHAPLGLVFVIAPWNYPLLTAVNSIVPALLSGNGVILKHSSQTPEIGLHFELAFGRLADHEQLLQTLFVDHDTTGKIIETCPVDQVIFTGSVQGGRQILTHTSKRFMQPVLELGGKDGAYVSPGANLELAAEGLVDGAMYNSGQSCCGIERAYVHEAIYEQLLERLLPLMQSYQLGDPLDEATTLGPLAQAHQAELLKKQIQQAQAQGAQVLTGGKSMRVGKGVFWPPTLVANVNHQMTLMTEENFGPILPIMKVKDLKQAISLINDSDYGLTAAIYTEDDNEAERFAAEVNVGTVFRNRCDYLDPALPWGGIKNSGCGCSLSQFGFLSVTRLKAIHFRTETKGD